MSVAPSLARRDELDRGLSGVRTRIVRACASAGRDPAEVTLVVVTKTFPASDISLLADLGVHDIGENRDQEASAKASALRSLGLTWHFVGQLQTNKAASVGSYADVVHSLDRPRVVAALGRAAHRRGAVVRGLVQVRLDDSTGRGGAEPADVPALADLVDGTEGLALAGVMAVAPLGADPVPAFARLTEVSATVRERHPDATWVSSGMSGDLEAAIAYGATHVRVGSAILGSRPPRG